MIECKWELPDMDSQTLGIQYTAPGTTHVHDDEMGVKPDADPGTPGIQVPCDLPASGGPPQMPDGVHNMIQVKPNLEDNPIRLIQLWMAAESPLGPNDISLVSSYWDVKEPQVSPTECPDGHSTPVDGWCSKVQVQPTKVALDACDDYGTGTSPDGSMFEAAVHTGQMTAEAVDNNRDGMIVRCQEEQKGLYYGQFELSKDQPCGEYRVDLTVSGARGSDTLTNYIDVICIFGLEIDFNVVDWAAISPGNPDVVGGDSGVGSWNPPSDTKPTVKNVGNDGMGLSLLFTTMWDPPQKQSIVSFDAKFGRDAGHLQDIDPMTAGVWYPFDSDPYRVLCANETGKLDLSIHPPTPLTPQTFLGKLNILGVARLGMCKGSHHVP